MSDWIPITTLVTGKPLRAQTFQEWWNDLYLLKSPVLAAQFSPGGTSNSWTFATVGVWADIDTSAYQVTFESQGNPLLVWAHIRVSHSAVSGDSYLTFILDGVQKGGTAGLGYNRDLNNQATRTVATVMTGVGAGSHTLKAQVNNQDTGNTEIWKDACLGLFALEF